MIARLPRRLSAWPRPTVVVDLPSPAGVGVIAETSTSGASGRPSRARDRGMEIFALSRPYGMKSSGIDADVARDLLDRAKPRLLGDLDVGFHVGASCSR